jgi:hypothetical protein
VTLRTLVALAAGLMLAAAAAPAAPAAARPLELTAHRILSFTPLSAPAADAPLTFLGGLQVSAADPAFGGFSGVDVVGDRLFMISDGGDYVRARLLREDGRLVGIEAAEIEPLMPGGDGSKQRGDVEDVAFDPRDPARGVVVRERQANALLSFRLENGRPTDFEPREVGAPNSVLRSNRGLESVAYAPDASPVAGSIVAIAEHPPRGSKTLPGWIVGVGGFEIVPHDGFDVSSARFLPDGDLLLLERRFSPAWALGVRIRRIPGHTVQAGALLDGEYLLDAGMTAQIDNMEGLAVRRDESGRTVLTLVSDDNQNMLQRTLILEFALEED